MTQIPYSSKKRRKMKKAKQIFHKYFSAIKNNKRKLRGLWKEYKSYNPGNAAVNLSVNNSELVARKIKLESLPVVVNFGTTSKCNMNPPCVMCLRNKEAQNTELSWRALLRAGYLADSASTLILHGVGEPLIYPRLFDIAKLASPGAMTRITTNGLLIDRYVKEICDHITKISISIDAATPHTYKKIRHKELDKVKQGIRKIVALKTERGQSAPHIDISMCLMRSNVSEASRFVEMGKELRVDSVHFYHMNEGPEYDWQAGWFDYRKEHCHLAPDEHDREIIAALKRAKDLDVPVVFYGVSLFNSRFEFSFADNPSEPPIPANVPVCIMPWRYVQINSDGTMMNCCYQTGAIGSLEEASFGELWNGECQKAIREGIISGKFHEFCKNAQCPVQGRL
jgi:MoaA/NifB/PqqE/SkfB family radical SAM enzyme